MKCAGVELKALRTRGNVLQHRKSDRGLDNCVALYQFAGSRIGYRCITNTCGWCGLKGGELCAWTTKAKALCRVLHFECLLMGRCKDVLSSCFHSHSLSYLSSGVSYVSSVGKQMCVRTGTGCMRVSILCVLDDRIDKATVVSLCHRGIRDRRRILCSFRFSPHELVALV